ncbi:MAG: ATP-binding cassette domain-containing protein [Bacteroidetes bacterium]|nr:ATP-binding cassette domain-containing protein [Bacteroidota bacterium]
MKITLTDAGKRFNRDWIFRHLSYEFISGHAYAITGPNGSGKSTLLQVIAGAMAPNEGTLKYQMAENAISVPAENCYRFLSYSAPYLELTEEMTVTEFLKFHHVFKPFMATLSIESIIEMVQLKDAAHKQIRYYSSGMKQRVKLAQAIFSDVPIVLLDEPCTNFDEEGIALYQRLIKDYGRGRLIIVSSNDKQEYGFCEEGINILDFKK